MYVGTGVLDCPRFKCNQGTVGTPVPTRVHVTETVDRTPVHANPMRNFMHKMHFLSYYLLTRYPSCAILYAKVNDRGAVHQKYMASSPHLPRMCGGDGKGWLPKAVLRETVLGLSRTSAGLSNGMFGVLSKTDSAPQVSGMRPGLRYLYQIVLTAGVPTYRGCHFF